MIMTNLPMNEETLEELHSAFEIIKQSRGEPDPELDQYFISEESSFQKACLLEPEQYTGKRTILLGDMDFTSLFIGLLSKPRDLAVLDIDKRLPEIIFRMKFDFKIKSIRFVNHDIRLRTIAILKHQFNYIFLEPPMTEEGLELGLSRAVQCAKKESDSRIFLSFDFKERKKILIDEYIQKMNLEIIDVKKDFNKYDYSTPLNKKTSDLYTLQVREDSVETIPHHYPGPTYFRESNSFPQPYRCKCGKVIQIGEEGEFTSVEELQSKGCPSCQYNEDFLYNSSIQIE